MHTDPPRAAAGDANPTILDARSRRGFLRTIALGGALLFVPGFAVACKKDRNGGPLGPGEGADIDLDFAQGDVALLQLAYAMEQLHADFFLRIVPYLDGGAYTDAEQWTLTDAKYHSVMHREYLKAALGSGADFTLTFNYDVLDFSNRSAFLAAARNLKLAGVGMYNGLAQYFTSEANLMVIAKMASVKARHAAALGVMIDPAANAFAPRAYEDVFRPTTAEAAMQAYIVQDIRITNAPATFAPGPNGNG